MLRSLYLSMAAAQTLDLVRNLADTSQNLAFVSNLVNTLTLRLEVVSPQGPDCCVSEKPAMPEIELRASIIGLDAAANQRAIFDWKVTLEHKTGCPHQTHFNATKHPPITAKTQGGKWKIPFTAIRGGTLTIEVKTVATAQNN